ncbi:MAG TPA: GNAT family N-acetyltransferase [Aggregatilineales bacterium]|nr:GNAT family N-acetyltransferase [Aggregatilineales bacterium]
MTFSVREAITKDIEELLRLWQERTDIYLQSERRQRIKQETWREAVLNWIQHDDAVVLVADRDGQLIGYIVGWVWHNPPLIEPAHYGLVSEMSVDGHCKQGGVGTAMLDHLKTWFRERELGYFEVRVPVRQPIEQAFWRAVGAKDFYDHLYYRLD